MDFLLPNERVGAAGDRSGACVIVSVDPPYEFRIRTRRNRSARTERFRPTKSGGLTYGKWLDSQISWAAGD